MTDAARKAQDLVYSAAEPLVHGESQKTQIMRAFNKLRAKQLGKSGYTKVWRAWMGRAGDKTYRELQEQADRIGFRPASLEDRLISTMEAMYAADEEFYGPAIEGIRAVLRAARGGVRGSEPEVCSSCELDRRVIARGGR